MKLPKITVEYVDEEDPGLGEISPSLIVGFGLHWAWVYLVMYNGTGLFHPGVATSPMLYFGTSLCVFVLMFLYYGVRIEKMRELFLSSEQRVRNRHFAAGLVFLGMVLLLLGNLIPALAPLFDFIAGVLTGIGSPILLMSFGVSFSVCDIATICINSAFSMIVLSAFASLFIIMFSASQIAGIILCMTIPIIEVLCLDHASRTIVDNLTFAENTLPVKKGRFAWRIGIPTLAMGLLLGIVREQTVSTGLFVASDTFLGPLALVLAGVTTCVIVILAMLFQRRTDNFMFRTLFPAAAFFLLVATLIGDNSPYAADYFAMVASLILDTTIWIALADLSQKYRISSFSVFGFGRAFMGLGTLVIFMLKNVPVIGLSFADISLLTCVTLFLVVLVYGLFPRYAEIRSTLVKGGSCPAIFTQAELDVITDELAIADAAAARAAEVGKKVTDMSDCQEGAEADTSGKRPANGQMAGADLEGKGLVGAGLEKASPTKANPAEASLISPVSPARAPQTFGQTEAGHVEAGQQGAFRPAAGASAGAAGASAGNTACMGDGMNAENGLMTRSVSSTAGTAVPGETLKTQGPDLSDEAKLGRFKRKCLNVADRYLLSRKETEVLFLLAKGNNSSSIQQALYISAGTVNTHMRHIYRKLSVHSQQELIDLVDATEDSL